MNENIIDHIKIKDFKCFKDFKVEGFDRVNLIGGENNTGKTTLMEACLLLRAGSTEDLYKKLLEIQTHRNIVSNLLSTTDRQYDLQHLIVDNIPLSIYSKHSYKLFYSIPEEEEEPDELVDCGKIEIEKMERYGEFHIYTRRTPLEIINCYDGRSEDGMPEKYTYSKLINKIDSSLRNTKYYFSLNFISPYSNSDEELIDIVGQAKIDGKYDDINNYLDDIFNVSAVDIVKKKTMLKKGKKYYNLSDFGQGIKTFINTIGSMLLLKRSIICIDEIENGIHYSHLDKFWEIVLTLSKKQNIQVFATTHSKECIESYARVAKRLEDKEITFVELGRDDNHEIKAMVYPYQWFLDEIEQEHEVRGW